MQINLKGKKYSLKNLTDQELDRADRIARIKQPLDECPTCGSRPVDIDGSGIRERINGTYKLDDVEYECECEAQMTLYRYYLLANIGEQYQRLDWNEWNGCEETKATTEVYLDNWKAFFRQGTGIEFYSRNLGTGKTFAATYIGKELIKRGESVYFIPFVEMVAAFDRRESDDISEKIKESGLIILDEVTPAVSEAQRHFFEVQLEALIRYRTNNNLPTIITTNMDQDTMRSEYSRIYSLLSAKQIRQPVTGTDHRGEIGLRDMEITVNGETRPIT